MRLGNVQLACKHSKRAEVGIYVNLQSRISVDGKSHDRMGFGVTLWKSVDKQLGNTHTFCERSPERS
jgi:hypothetical protein